MVCASSDKVPRASPYSGAANLIHSYGYGTITLYRWISHAILLEYISYVTVLNPNSMLVWAPPLSLAATDGIDFSFFSSRY